ncbi:hypothetical protein ACFQY4_06495 [Catellatospora bangladeshensis]|uniref:Uncharacterized protein n=1 Tax=Catellatospora bangladeshensis TaxID=310355 RepID=A0A8J3JTY2_9ACTN|nr:hypothetical protein [Catellatospora bangladeshensis]GIF85110.1 hypothetical protein Cba03nite_64590 [Catellatospora bangladeshensis]
MSTPDLPDLLIYAGIPLAVIGIIFALVYAAGGRNAKRYRPGRPYQFKPVWFLARPESDGPAAAHGALEAAARAELTASGDLSPVVDVTGGASDRW